MKARRKLKVKQVACKKIHKLTSKKGSKHKRQKVRKKEYKKKGCQRESKQVIKARKKRT